ncbi:MAG: hypothetical protein WCY86_02670 [Spirosomataceae bacterium]
MGGLFDEIGGSKKRTEVIKVLFYSALCGCLCSSSTLAQTGSIHEPVRYVGGVTIDPNVHEGRLRYAIGVESRQTLRVNRTHPELADDHGWTYNHASNLTYWNGTFYQQYLSNPVDEHIAPGQTLLITSKDGRNWSKPEVIFPPYEAPPGVKVPEGYDGYMMHQRMGFYVAPNGKLLTLAFYGHAEDPFEKGGIGRVVREIKKDGSYGPIYFIRYSSHTDWNETNTSYPFYKRSEDRDFVAACDSLLSDPLITLQWRDEDNGLDGFYEGERGGSALSYYKRKDGKIVGLWKRSRAALSEDGRVFSKSVKCPTLIMSGGKVWGQATKDGRYSLVYNPIDLTQYRFPLIVISGDDGIIFDDMLLVQAEVPPRRFYGRWKDFGPCYVRGIEGYGDSPGTDMWLTYSMNKEDMWVSRVPVPIRYKVEGPVHDHFDNFEIGGSVPDWNIYAPKWAPVDLVNSPNRKGLALELRDEDPYDYARAIRVFEETEHARIEMDIMAGQDNQGILEIEVTDQFGNRPVRIRFTEKREIIAASGGIEKIVGQYRSGVWHTLKLEVNGTISGAYDLYWDGKKIAEKFALSEAVKSVERISFRTGAYRDQPNRTTPNQEPAPPLPGADEKEKLTRFLIDNVKVK